jgi:DNA end-binding protein Ku
LASSISLSGYTRPLKARAWLLICSKKKDLSRIRFQRVAESTGKEVPAEEIVKGYEVEKNQYVILADEELREVAPERSTGIEIQEFVNEAEISSLYFEKPY